jgi:Ni/Fe-hydrogenase 1 B-type cytochrome subunit
VWELPVRAYHWINAIALVTLCVTGYLIGAPIRAFYAAEAYQQYWFGTVRFIHFVAAFVYVFNFLARLYWGFVGNTYARWPNYFPLQKAQRQEIAEVIKADVLQTQLHGPISTGHNALAGLIYFFTFLAFVAQTITGFRALLQHEQFVAAAYVCLGCAAAGRRVRRALLAPPVPVVLCHLRHRSHLSCLLSRLHRGPRHGLLDYRRMEV